MNKTSSCSSIPAHVFREYDVRGMVGSELTPEFAYLLGAGYSAFAIERGKDNIAIGWDCRLSSEEFARELARGISESGLNCYLTGMGPTPQLYFGVFACKTPEGTNFGGGIQVTGSHNPADMNGFKMMVGDQTLSGPEIQQLRTFVERVASGDKKVPSKSGIIGEVAVRQDYINYLIENSKPFIGPRKLKVVVDAGNGVGGMIGPPVLRALGVDVIELYCEPDGTFPNHHPDPTVLKNITTLIETVKREKADFGIGWDGDGDRIGVVDETGAPVFGDMLLLAFASSILKEQPGATIIGDVKCSSLLFDGVKAAGGNPIMWKTGHSLVKAKLRETGAALAGEMSGHIFFKHRFFGFDDALYASNRLVEIVSHLKGPFSSLYADLPKMYSTPEIRVDCPEEKKFKIAQRAQSAFSEYSTDLTDGVRITFDAGWGLIRASNTQPVLVMRFEAESQELLAKYKKLVEDRLAQLMRD